MLIVRHELPSDLPAVRHVNEEAFGRPAEADLVDALRAAGKAVVSLVAEDEGEVRGHVLFSEVTIEASGLPVNGVALAPVAVLPAYQRGGLGAALVRAGIEECRRLRYGLAVLVGHPGYYPRFGFRPARERGLVCEFDVPDEAWMVLELREGALDGAGGRVRFADEFRRLDSPSTP